jgi:hypothetical protein
VALDVTSAAENDKEGAGGVDAATIAARLVVTTSSGAVQGWSPANDPWTREESLATVANGGLHTFIELPEPSGESGPGSEGLIGRLARQVLDLQVRAPWRYRAHSV